MASSYPLYLLVGLLQFDIEGMIVRRFGIQVFEKRDGPVELSCTQQHIGQLEPGYPAAVRCISAVSFRTVLGRGAARQHPHADGPCDCRPDRLRRKGFARAVHAMEAHGESG